jgi:hypothetical protein
MRELPSKANDKYLYHPFSLLGVLGFWGFGVSRIKFGKIDLMSSELE